MNIRSVKYAFELNQVDCYGNKARNFLADLPVGVIIKNLERLIEEIVPENEWEDIHLKAFLISLGGGNCLMPYVEFREDLSLVVFPGAGKIDYRLPKNYDFLSNIHQNPDPIVIRSILDALPLHPTKRNESVWFPGWHVSAPNYINGAFLYKTNPFEPITKYPGFEEMMNPLKE